MSDHKWIRARFQANYDDSRPVKWPPPGPFWETGWSCDESHAIVVAYVRTLAQIKEYWPEASEIETEAVDDIVFTARFEKPEWWKDEA